jgi:hypothetical protein
MQRHSADQQLGSCRGLLVQVLCADKRFEDFFGMDPASLSGTNFSSLGTDMEAVER